MKLRFIGADGSMGLRYNHIYDVNIISAKHGYIMVEWYDKTWMRCPYISPQTFAENWEGINGVNKWGK